ncbi:flavin reductase family protein [Nocardioides sp. GCM10027113]|uniref:flavin reductase family protein n=1 Tax=unclassified Nocardioides TaxID=2615069 RepID=UPI00361EBDAC
MTITALDPAQLRHAFGAFPSGVVAVAARVDGALTGMAASSFTSVSLDPPLVSFSVANGSSTWPLLRRSERLGLSVLADHHGAACRRLAGPAAQRFEGLDVADAAGGAVLLPDAVTTFECVVHEELPAGDHTIVLLRLVDWHEGAGSPLVFHRSAFARLRDALTGGAR